MPSPFNTLSLALLGLLISLAPPALMAAESGCPSGDLPSFVQAFASSPELQKTYTRSPLIEQRPAYGDQGYGVTTLHKVPAASAASLALLDPKVQAKAGLQTFWIDKRSLVVHDSLGDVLQVFVFQQLPCWTLVRVEQWSLQGLLDERAPANETPLQRELRKADLFEGYGAVELYPLTTYFFELAQRIDLHAADNGSAAGATRAVILGYSGMSPEVEPARIESLLSTYAESDVEAKLLLADFYCFRGNQVSERKCQAPRQAEDTVTQAARQFDTGMAYATLGYGYSEGLWGTTDLPRALSCFKEAADRHEPSVLQNLVHYAKEGQVPQPGVSCLQAPAPTAG